MDRNLDSLQKAVPGDYYDQAIATNLLQRFWHGRRFAEVQNFLNGIKAKRILDIGCHGGRFTFEISKKFQSSAIYGIDVSEAGIEYAQKRYKNMHFYVARAEKLPFRTNYFDMVTCFEVLEHIDEPMKVIREVVRVLKKSGNFIVLIPTENFLFRLIWLIWTHFGLGRVWRHTHVQSFRNHTLDVLLKKSGFAVIKRKSFLLGMLFLIQAKKK